MPTELETQRGMVRVPTGTWSVDPAHSSVEFRVKHMMISTVRGHFAEFEATIEAAPDFATPHTHDTDSMDRGTATATESPGPMPRSIRTRARREDHASRSS